MSSSSDRYLLIGCGYTGRRVARRLLTRGCEVVATARDPSSLADLEARGATLLTLDALQEDTLQQFADAVPLRARVLISTPTVKAGDRLLDLTPRLVAALGDRPARVVYLSTTGVYGKTSEVDEHTPVGPLTERQRLRVAAEQAVAAGPWPSLILRPAAIYGPGRGAHVALRQGRYKLVGDGANLVSRIHVEDLATHAESALHSDAIGAWPVADDHACPSSEIAAFCANLLGLPLPPSVSESDVSETRRANRRVDGSAIRRLLCIELRYPSYREGIPAGLAEE